MAQLLRCQKVPFVNNTDLMKEKTNLIKKINHLYQYPEFDENFRKEINKKLQEIVDQLINQMEEEA